MTSITNLEPVLSENQNKTNAKINELINNFNNVKWLSRAVGEVVYIWDHMTGANIPATDSTSYRYVKLTASDTYNTGVIINETASNTGTPDSVYLGTINLTNSPLNGEIIHMINSERSIIRPRAGSSGVLQYHATQRIQGSVGPVMSFAGGSDGDNLISVGYDGTGTPNTGANSYRRFDIDSAGVIRTDTTYDETRVKNIGTTAYLRIY